MAKRNKCVDCNNLLNGQCNSPGNIGILAQYRQEKKIYLKSIQVLNKNGNCKNYVELFKK